MKKAILISCLLAAILAAFGCTDPGTISQSDMEAVRKENGTQAYEDAMRKAGRGEELEQQKAADAARGGGQ